MSEVDRYITGLVENLNNLRGTLSGPANIEGLVENPNNLRGTLSSSANIEGKLSNATLRGMSIELRLSGTMLQWKYEDETDNKWRDLIDLAIHNYEDLNNLPTVYGTEIKGEMGGYIMTTDDELSNIDIADIIR